MTRPLLHAYVMHAQTTRKQATPTDKIESLQNATHAYVLHAQTTRKQATPTDNMKSLQNAAIGSKFCDVMQIIVSSPVSDVFFQ